MLRNILILLLSALVASSVQEIICYNCNSYFNKSCEKPMPNMVNFITHCDATNFPNKFREGASQFIHLLKTPFLAEGKNAEKQQPKRPICFTLVLKDSKGVKVHIRSCGIDTFGAKDMCELIEAADGKDEVTKTLCKHCDEKLCNNHSRAISLSTETFAYYPLLCAVYWINR